MTATKTKTQPAPALVLNMVSKYRLSRDDYMRIQACRRLAKLEKLKVTEYTRADGVQDMKVGYKLNGKTFEAQNLDEWAHIIAEKLASLVEQWTPNDGVVRLTEMLSSMKFSDPEIKIDLTKLTSGRIPAKLKGIITIADNAGWGLNQKGEIIQLDEMLSAITAAEKLGMVFRG